MTQSIQLNYGDNPIRAATQDWLNRADVCRALGRVLHDDRLDMPLAIGIYGAWGSGKTSIMRLLIEQLDPGDLYIWFNAWEYAQHREALWRAFLLALVSALRRDSFLARLLASYEAQGAYTPKQKQAKRRELVEELDRMAASLYRSQTFKQADGINVNWQTGILLGARLVLRAVAPVVGEEALKVVQQELAKGKDVEDALQLFETRYAEEYREHIQSLEQFRLSMHDCVRRYVNETGRRLFIFIDDLDRCLPEDAVSVLEAIKVFFDAPDGDALNCVFVLGMDRNVVEQGIRVRYREFALGPQMPLPVDARQYLDKIIQLPFNVPPLNDGQMKEYIERWCRESGQAELAACSKLIAIGVAPNPRSVKRTLNVLRLMSEQQATTISSAGRDRLKQLAKLVVLQTSYDDVYRDVVDRAEVLRELEAESRKSAPSTHKMLVKYPRLKAMLHEAPGFPQSDMELNELLFLVRSGR